MLAPLVLLMISAPLALAGDVPEACSKGAKIVHSLAELRDEGYTLDAVVNDMHAVELREVFSPWTPDAVVQLTHVVYSRPGMNPRDLANDFFHHCLAARVGA